MTNVFHTYHPAVAFVFLASALALSMACLHPVFTALSLAGALACSCVCRGGRATLLSLRWIVPLCLVVAAANPFFVASGSTELFRIGQRAIYAEALLYGLCSGGMFASVFLWFASYSSCMDSENSLALFGNAAPVVTLMVSQILRLVPQFVSRGRAIADVQDGMSAAAPRTRKDVAQGRMRIVSVLMGWGMEDAVVLAAVVALALASAVCAWLAFSGFSFYPVVAGVASFWLYLPYALLMLVPPALWLRDWLQWRSCE